MCDFFARAHTSRAQAEQVMDAMVNLMSEEFPTTELDLDIPKYACEVLHPEAIFRIIARLEGVSVAEVASSPLDSRFSVQHALCVPVSQSIYLSLSVCLSVSLISLTPHTHTKAEELAGQNFDTSAEREQGFAEFEKRRKSSASRAAGGEEEREEEDGDEGGEEEEGEE